MKDLIRRWRKDLKQIPLCYALYQSSAVRRIKLKTFWVSHFECLYSKKISLSHSEAMAHVFGMITTRIPERPVDLGASGSIDISIIIPVYNVERFVAMCLDSVIRQKTRYTFEILVIEDGSTDQSLAIVAAFKDDRIRVLYQRNQGVSAARNAGIDAARGRYLLFVDSDDYLLPEALETLMNAAIEKQADIVQGQYHRVSEHSQYLGASDLPVTEVYHFNGFLRYPGFAWGKLFRRRLFDGIRFPVGFWFEDTIIPFLIFSQCRLLTCLPEAICAYRSSRTSVSNRLHGQSKVVDTYTVVAEILVILKSQLKRNESPEIYRLLLWQLSAMSYPSRLRHLDEMTIRSIFILSAHLIHRYREALRLSGLEFPLTKQYKRLETAYLTADYGLWKAYSEVIQIEVNESDLASSMSS